MAGNDPIVEPLILTRGADFVHDFKIDAKDPDIPDGTAARIEVTKTSKTDAPIIATWTLTPEARQIRARVEAEDSGDDTTIGNQYRYRLLVNLPDAPTLDHCWLRGPIVRRQ